MARIEVTRWVHFWLAFAQSPSVCSGGEQKEKMDTIIRWLKRFGLGGGIVLVFFYVLFCVYSLPSHMKVHVTGTEVTRMDKDLPDGRVNTYDVRYVMVEDLDGDPHMFRNEDTGWGWPPYFKFDTGDIAAQANNYSVDAKEEVVLVQYYGFRIRMLSLYPNILSMKTVTADYQSVPWFTIFFGLANLVLVGFLVVVVRDFKDGREDKR
jgi:hypothetical protein